MIDHAFEGSAQSFEVGLAYRSLSTIVITSVAVDAIVPHRYELHKRFLGRFVWKNGRAERTSIVQIDLRKVVVHQLAQAGMDPVAKSSWIGCEFNNADLLGSPLLVTLHQ